MAEMVGAVHTQGNLINIVKNDVHIVLWNNIYITDKLII